MIMKLAKFIAKPPDYDRICRLIILCQATAAIRNHLRHNSELTGAPSPSTLSP